MANSFLLSTVRFSCILQELQKSNNYQSMMTSKETIFISNCYSQTSGMMRISQPMWQA